MKNKLVIIIAAVVLLLGGGGVAYYFLVSGQTVHAEAKKNKHHKNIEYEDEEHEDTAGYEEEDDEEEHAGGHGGGHGGESGPKIEPFVVNLADPGSRRYLRLNLKLTLKKPTEDEALLDARMPQLRDTVLLLLSSKTTDQLLGLEGKSALRQELITTINKVLKKRKRKKPVKNLYFTEFLIQ